MNEVERYIARRTMLTDRRETIETRMDVITDRLYQQDVPVNEFEDLTTEYRNLTVEIGNVENELRIVYKIKL